jgi:aldehyde:ferredoxin oxidoreductase
MFNVREGVGKEADALPWRLMHEPLKRKNGDMGMNSPEEMGNMLERYYEIRGWDRSGRPEWNTLAMNGLDAVTTRKDLEHGH